MESRSIQRVQWSRGLTHACDGAVPSPAQIAHLHAGLAVDILVIAAITEYFRSL